VRWRAITAAALALATFAAGCGGSGGDKGSSTGATRARPSARGAVAAPTSSNAPTPPGDLGYLTVDYERATFEALAAGIARPRASSAAVRAYAARLLRERGEAARDDAVVAQQLKLKLRPRGIAAADRDALRGIVRLTGSRFDTAYLRLETASLAGDVSRATTAAARAKAARVRSTLSKHAALYHGELDAARSAR
jgi:predicted outer membrane protein